MQIAIGNYIGLSSTQGVDPEVTDYASRVTAAGGTLNNSQLLAVNTLNRAIRTAIGSKVIDYGVYIGGSATPSLVKVRYIDSTYKSYALSGTITYAESTGLSKAAAGAGKISSQFDPATNGLSITNISCGYFMLDCITAGASQNNMSTNPASGNPGFYQQSLLMAINPATSVDMPQVKPGDPEFRFFSKTTTGVLWGRNYTSMYAVPPASGPAIPELSAISFLGGRAGGAEMTSGRGRIAFTWVGEYFTYSEIMAIQDAVRTFLVAIGRLTESNECVFFGDSITKGVNASAYTNRYSYLTAAAFGLRERNLGIVSSSLTASTATVNGGYDRRAELLKYNILNGGKVVIQYGVNDMVTRDVTADGNATIMADYTTKLATIITELKAAGVSGNNIYVGSPSYVNTATANLTKQTAWRAAARAAVVAAGGCMFVDVGQYMQDNGGATLLSDSVHPTDSGHAAINTCHTTLSTFVSS